MRLASALLLVVACGAVEGCDAGVSPLRIWAAASLSDVVPELTRAFIGRDGGPVEHSFDATSRLAGQIEEGAPADVFLSADLAWIRHLHSRGVLVPGSDRRIASSHLVVVVPAGSPAPGDLATLVSRVRRLGLAGEGVPAGRYADAALNESGLTSRAAPRIVRGGSVRTVLAWVAAGEVDAGIVYDTDARVEPRVEIALTLDLRPESTPAYSGAVVARAADPERAARYLDLARSEEGRAIFSRHGFAPE